MELVVRAAVIYAFVLVILRISGKRQFSEITTFDLVLLLIISEAASQGLYGSADYSLTASLLLVTTLAAMDIGLSLIKHRFRLFEALLRFLAEKLRRIEGVRDTETFVYLRMVKQTYQWGTR